jgi:glycosyltransferase involved in cell wall biosynthesis
MKIAQINTDAVLASTGTIASHLMQKLNEDGNECRLFYGRGIGGSPDHTTRFSLKWEVLLHGLQTRLLGTHAQGSPISTKKLLRLLDDFQPDIIHIHNAHGYYLNLYTLLDYILLKDIPLVWTFHDAWPFTGHCIYYYDCSRWQYGCGKCPMRNDYPRSMLFDRSAKQWHKKYAAVQKLKRLIVAAPSKWLADAAERSFFRGKSIRIINNGIDTENIFVPMDASEARRTFGIQEDKFVLAAVASGFGDMRKGGHYLKQLAQRFIDKPVHFVVAGWQEHSDKLPENMSVFPLIRSPREMACFYNMADAFLLLSVADNFPTVCIESLACGIPVIGFAAGGAPEQIDEYTGKFVPVGDIEGLESVISKDILNRSGSFLKERCRRRATMLYSKQAMYEGYLKCYRDALSLL